MTIAIVIRGTKPNIDRGASVQWSPNGSFPWLSVAYADDLAEALQVAGKEIGRQGRDKEIANWRIVCHPLDAQGTN